MIGGQTIRGEEQEVLKRARSAGFGRVYGIHYIKSLDGTARVAVSEYSQTLDPDQPWRMNIFSLPSYVVEGIAGLISKYKK